jgi:N-acetyl sugar amidotransferase
MTRRSKATPFEPLKVLSERAAADGKSEIKRCAKCLMVETNETMTFDEDGVCNICQSFEDREQWNAAEKEEEFREIIEQYRGKHLYDAVVPFSGGKDSAWVAYVLTRKYKMKILLATYDSNFRRPTHLQNVDRLVRELNVDHVTFRSRQDVIIKTMQESMKRKGDFCWFCHTGVCSFPMKAAMHHKTPLIVWGEPNSEYAVYTRYQAASRRLGEEPEGNERAFNRMMNLGINAEDMAGYIEGVEERDMEPYRFPRYDELEELRSLGLRNVCLGDYQLWEPIKQIETLKAEIGWESAPVEGLHPMYDGEKVECFLQGSRDYLRYIKRGYSRTNQRANAEIRRGDLPREEALVQEEHDSRRPVSLPVITDFMDMTEERFNEIAAAHSIAPWVYDPSVAEDGEPLPDHEYWKKELRKHVED